MAPLSPRTREAGRARIYGNPAVVGMNSSEWSVNLRDEDMSDYSPSDCERILSPQRRIDQGAEQAAGQSGSPTRRAQTMNGTAATGDDARTGSPAQQNGHGAHEDNEDRWLGPSFQPPPARAPLPPGPSGPPPRRRPPPIPRPPPFDPSSALGRELQPPRPPRPARPLQRSQGMLFPSHLRLPNLFSNGTANTADGPENPYLDALRAGANAIAMDRESRLSEVQREDERSGFGRGFRAPGTPNPLRRVMPRENLQAVVEADQVRMAMERQSNITSWSQGVVEAGNPAVAMTPLVDVFPGREEEREEREIERERTARRRMSRESRGDEPPTENRGRQGRERQVSRSFENAARGRYEPSDDSDEEEE